MAVIIMSVGYLVEPGEMTVLSYVLSFSFAALSHQLQLL